MSDIIPSDLSALQQRAIHSLQSIPADAMRRVSYSHNDFGSVAIMFRGEGSLEAAKNLEAFINAQAFENAGKPTVWNSSGHYPVAFVVHGRIHEAQSEDVIFLRLNSASLMPLRVYYAASAASEKLYKGHNAHRLQEWLGEPDSEKISSQFSSATLSRPVDKKKYLRDLGLFAVRKFVEELGLETLFDAPIAFNVKGAFAALYPGVPVAFKEDDYYTLQMQTYERNGHHLRAAELGAVRSILSSVAHPAIESGPAR